MESCQNAFDTIAAVIIRTSQVPKYVLELESIVLDVTKFNASIIQTPTVEISSKYGTVTYSTENTDSECYSLFVSIYIDTIQA